MSTGPVLVGIDDSGGGRDALALGHRLSELVGGSVETVTVSASTPVAALASEAARQRAALIVLGPTHHRVLVRSTARRLLIGAPCPVAVAPGGFASQHEAPLRCIGVGYEPTPEAAGALRVAHQLARSAHGSLLVIGAALPLSPLAIDDLRDREPYLDDERRAVQRGLDRAIEALPPGVPTVADARIGDPAGELVELSRSVDLLVCGSRRRGRLRATLLGSVTQRLLRGASCPILIVPSPAAQPERSERMIRSTVLPPPRG